MEAAESFSDVPFEFKGETTTSLLKFNGQQGKEMLKFMPNGDIFIYGRLATNDMEVVEGIREWLKSTGYIKPKEESQDI